MAATVVTNILCRLQPTRKLAYDGGTKTLPVTLEENLTWASGSGTSAADEMYTDSFTITAGAYENLDLTALAQQGASGETDRTVAFANIKWMMIRNTTATGTGGRLQIGAGTDAADAADAWSGTTTPFEDDTTKIQIPEATPFIWGSTTGGTVTNGSADVLCLAAITQDQTVEIVLVGDHT